MSVGITAIVLTLNEATHLPGCLESIAPLTADVIVLDSGSTDSTLAIALSAGARVEHRSFDGYANQRNAALALPGLAPWVLFIDADERLSLAGVGEIRAAIRRADDRIAVFELPRRNLVFGRTLKGGGWWPDHQARVMRPCRARYDPRHQVHEQLRAQGMQSRLHEPLIHINYSDWSEFHSKQRGYSHTLAADIARTCVVPARKEYVSAPLHEFRRRFVNLRGYRDGLLGMRLALAMSREEMRVRWLVRHNRTC